MADDKFRALSSAVDAIESRFLTMGTISMSMPLTINTATFPVNRGAMAAETAKLTAVAEASPFGKGAVVRCLCVSVVPFCRVCSLAMKLAKGLPCNAYDRTLRVTAPRPGLFSSLN